MGLTQSFLFHALFTCASVFGIARHSAPNCSPHSTILGATRNQTNQNQAHVLKCLIARQFACGSSLCADDIHVMRIMMVIVMPNCADVAQPEDNQTVCVHTASICTVKNIRPYHCFAVECLKFNLEALSRSCTCLRRSGVVAEFECHAFCQAPWCTRFASTPQNACIDVMLASPRLAKQYRVSRMHFGTMPPWDNMQTQFNIISRHGLVALCFHCNVDCSAILGVAKL